MSKITLYIPEELVRKAKYTALDRKTSVSQAVTAFLSEWTGDNKTAYASGTTETKSEYSSDEKRPD